MSCASVTYLLLVESAISAVVASAQAVTSPFASYVILVLVAHVIATFSSTFPSRAVWVAVEIGLFTSEVLSTLESPTSDFVSQKLVGTTSISTSLFHVSSVIVTLFDPAFIFLNSRFTQVFCLKTPTHHVQTLEAVFDSHPPPPPISNVCLDFSIISF